MKWTNEDMERPDSVELGATYDATVTQATEKVSKAGNDYINLKLAVYADPDKPATLYTVVMPSFPDKFTAFLMSAGMYRQLASQEIYASDCEGKNCKVIIGKEKNDKGYAEVDTFEIPADAAARLAEAKKELAAAPAVSDSDLPF
jgi:hypothetical protein